MSTFFKLSIYKHIQVIVGFFKKIFFKKKKKSTFIPGLLPLFEAYLKFIFWKCRQNQKYNILHALNIDSLFSFEDKLVFLKYPQVIQSQV